MHSRLLCYSHLVLLPFILRLGYWILPWEEEKMTEEVPVFPVSIGVRALVAAIHGNIYFGSSGKHGLATTMRGYIRCIVMPKTSVRSKSFASTPGGSSQSKL